MYAAQALENTSINDVFVPKVLTPKAKRAVIESMVLDHQLFRSKTCKLVGLSRSALYKPKTDWAAKDEPVVDALNEIVAVSARWEFWKCITEMRKDGLAWNHKRV
jgi:putative transposase